MGFGAAGDARACSAVGDQSKACPRARPGLQGNSKTICETEGLSEGARARGTLRARLIATIKISKIRLLSMQECAILISHQTKGNKMKNFGFAVFMTEYFGTTTGAQVREVYEMVASLHGETLTSLTPERDLEAGWDESEYYLAGLVSQEAFAGIVEGVRARGLRVKEANFDIPKHATESLSAYGKWWNEDFDTRKAIWERQDAEDALAV